MNSDRGCAQGWIGQWSKGLCPQLYLWLPAMCSCLLLAATVRADDIVFEEFATQQNGIQYARIASERKVKLDQLRRQRIFQLSRDLPKIPGKPYGAPGVVIFDIEQDGDLDVFVTNGPGRANSLFANQLVEQGVMKFVDVAAGAGVGMVAQDSNGACAGDIDNDGDQDLLVLAAGPAVLFENQGDGGFVDISVASGVAAVSERAASCTLGDINNDGLLDIAIARMFSVDDFRGITQVPFEFNLHNKLLLNLGGNRFEDVSKSSGMETLAGFPSDVGQAASPSWAIALVDYDQDGDSDLIFADDQGTIPPAMMGGVDRGMIHILQNDGTGQFTDVSTAAGTNIAGQWMGLSFGDFNCDGHLDFFASNGGDYTIGLMMRMMGRGQYKLGSNASRWFLGQADHRFADVGLNPELKASVFGWGTSVADFDNDGDGDITYHGGIEMAPLIMTVPGVMLENQACQAKFLLNNKFAESTTKHFRRSVHGVAVGDLNNDGRVDRVSVSGMDLPSNLRLTPMPVRFAAPLDYMRFYMEFKPVLLDFLLLGKFEYFIWKDVEYLEGTLSVEVNQTINENRWVKLELRGAKDLLTNGMVNRDGIGAIVRFTPADGVPTLVPVIAGGSQASQNALQAHFGLGTASQGELDILWPGGVRNHLYQVRPGEHIRFPEIPCSYTDAWDSDLDYMLCVHGALTELVAVGEINNTQSSRFFASALLAFDAANTTP